MNIYARGWLTGFSIGAALALAVLIAAWVNGGPEAAEWLLMPMVLLALCGGFVGLARITGQTVRRDLEARPGKPSSVPPDKWPEPVPTVAMDDLDRAVAETLRCLETMLRLVYVDDIPKEATRAKMTASEYSQPAWNAARLIVTEGRLVASNGWAEIDLRAVGDFLRRITVEGSELWVPVLGNHGLVKLWFTTRPGEGAGGNNYLCAGKPLS